MISYKKDIYLTGGDAEKLLCIFKSATLNKNLLFDGMKKLIQLNFEHILDKIPKI
ncbi:MAG: hypothetical protein Q9M43_11460 [Sulfurimonas sp.]|nr:hypothetical protein [Sulfurimonas sp.]